MADAPSPPLEFTTSPSLPAPLLLPPSAFLPAHPHIDYIMAGAIVFARSRAGPLKTLLIRRAPSDSYPLRWEVPGGSADATDASLAAAAARELWEETGLRARRVLCAAGAGLPRTGDGCCFDAATGVCTFGETGDVWGKATFVVDVEQAGGGVVLRPDEHVDWAWVTEDEVRSGRFDEEGRGELDMDSFIIPRQFVPLLVPRELASDPDAQARQQTAQQEPALEPAVHEPRAESAAEHAADGRAGFAGQLAAQQQRRRYHVRRRDLADGERQVGLRVLQQARHPLGEEVERLDDAVGAPEQDDAAEREADDPRPRQLVQLGVPVAGQQAQEPVDGVAAREASRGRVGPTHRGQGRGEDTVEAVAAEGVRGGEEEAANRRRGADRCRAVVLHEGEVGREASLHGLEASNLNTQRTDLGLVTRRAANGAHHLAHEPAAHVGPGVVRVRRQPPLQLLQPVAFGDEHLAGRLQARLFPVHVGLGDGSLLARRDIGEGVPGRRHGREAREQGHERDADDAHPLQAPAGQGLDYALVLDGGAPRRRDRNRYAHRPKGEQPARKENRMHAPCDPRQCSLCRALEAPARAADDGTTFQPRHQHHQHEQQRRHSDTQGQGTRQGVEDLENLGKNQRPQRSGERDRRAKRPRRSPALPALRAVLRVGLPQRRRGVGGQDVVLPVAGVVGAVQPGEEVPDDDHIDHGEEGGEGNRGDEDRERHGVGIGCLAGIVGVTAGKGPHGSWCWLAMTARRAPGGEVGYAQPRCRVSVLGLVGIWAKPGRVRTRGWPRRARRYS
ncbi:hypothetical protein S7711_03338 [Stachybotrys chartarum IBT 7711]|uniref:Nudix hydrolase domain-containing protein n=1 Tax=Stachybotrys chartarum (strain CBS 109288 / IBT 7711) TaxID=1280523 RepID=A0A084AUR0_STACB|nr:hypothetical protein S7711_03338 [Stachybotrys chartarum IBT 7711]